MARRSDLITSNGLTALWRHHPYLLLFQKEDWQDYILLLAEIYDVIEEQSIRVPIDAARSIATRFYSLRNIASLDQKVSSFFSMAIGELQVLKDSHDQFGQRYIETTRGGKSLLHLVESLVAQRNKYSGTSAETLLGALNDILLSRKHMTIDEAIKHHREKIEAFKEDLIRIKKEGLSSAQLLPMAHSNEALFSQAEEASIHVLQSIEDVKSAIESQRKELAEGYFQNRRSAGETLGAVADFYSRLYASPEYASYTQAKEILSYIEGYQRRFALRNIDRLLHSIEGRELLPADLVKKSNLRSFMHQFSVADSTIQEKIKAQIFILQQQVLYAIATDVEGLKANLHDLLANFARKPSLMTEFWSTHPLTLNVREDFDLGPVTLFDYELPLELESQAIEEVSFDIDQERDLLLALLRAEEGTLKDILGRLLVYFDQHKELHAKDHTFPQGLAEYYVLSEIELFDLNVEKYKDGISDLKINSKHGHFILRNAPSFILRQKENHGEA
jgi:hypothetical protein